MIPELSDGPVQALTLPGIDSAIELYVKRDDLIHPLLGGNKWRKLVRNMESFRNSGKASLLTYGGAWSNHIAAVAKVGRLNSISTIGVIRGEQPKNPSTTLLKAESDGMHLHYISREDYRKKDSSDFAKGIREKFGEVFIIPEGGANLDGAAGCQAIMEEVGSDYHIVACACGTGTTLAGIASRLEKNQQAWGVAVMKEGEYLNKGIADLIGQLGGTKGNWKLITKYHFGGYARLNSDLVEFMREVYRGNLIKLDPVYTAKLFYGVWSELKQSDKYRGKKILLVHSGGLQGLPGIEQQLGYSIYPDSQPTVVK